MLQYGVVASNQKEAISKIIAGPGVSGTFIGSPDFEFFAVNFCSDFFEAKNEAAINIFKKIPIPPKAISDFNKTMSRGHDKRHVAAIEEVKKRKLPYTMLSYLQMVPEVAHIRGYGDSDWDVVQTATSAPPGPKSSRGRKRKH